MKKLTAFTIVFFSFTTSVLAVDIETNQRCPGPAEKGPCNRKLFKWTYDPEKKFCSMFVWGGCAGNDKNRFDTEVQCMKTCAPHINGKLRI